MDTRRTIAAILIIVLIVGAAPALAALADYAVPIQEEVPVQDDDTPQIILAAPDGADTNLVDIWEGDELNITTSEGDIRVSGDTNATARLAVDDIEGDQTEVTEIDAGSDWIELDPADKNRVDVRGDAETLAFSEIGVDDGETDLQVSGPEDGSAELRLHDLEVDTQYALYDASRDEVLGTAASDGGGVADPTVDLPDGSHAIEVRTYDSFGDPSATDPEPSGTVESVPENLSVDVTADAYPATVEFTFEGEVVDTVEVEENGTVTTDNISVTEDQTYDWSATVTDDLDQTDTASASFDMDIDDPTVSDLSPTGELTEQPDEVTANVTAGAHPTEVAFIVEGEIADTVTVNDSGTVTGDVSDAVDDLGEYNYTVEATDAINQTGSADGSFETPSVLTLREEHDPQTRVNNSSATVRFFTTDGEVAIERTADDEGEISLEGLPNSEFVVFVESENHYDRTIYVESIFEQNNMFLLNETEFPRDDNEAVRSRFVYEDLTGDFPREETTIQVERAIDINDDGESEFRTVAGDYWGASNEFEGIFERGTRYRVTLINRETGETYRAGSHIPTEELSQTIRVSGLVEEAENESGVFADAAFTDDGDIELLYQDAGNETDDLTVTVEPRGGGDPIYTDNVSGPLGTYGETVELNDSQADEDWVVRFDAGDRHTSAEPVGSGSIDLPLEVPGWILTLLGSMGITFVGALYGPRTAIIGCWSMVFVSAGLAMFGWGAFTGVSVLVAMLIAVAATFIGLARP